MNLDLKNKKVFISGSTKGIGFETAKVFIEEGASVIINGRTKDSVEEAIKKLNNKNVSGLIADFLDESQVDELINKIPEDVDIIVNNVGIFRGKDFYSETDDDWNDH
ncbi:MAG: SDR family NAD(P)-dependent oxidoreductase, partial [Flavobacteriales bacterium]